MVPVLEWPGSNYGQSHYCVTAMWNADLLSGPVGEDGGEVDGLEGKGCENLSSTGEKWLGSYHYRSAQVIGLF